MFFVLLFFTYFPTDRTFNHSNLFLHIWLFVGVVLITPVLLLILGLVTYVFSELVQLLKSA